MVEETPATDDGMDEMVEEDEEKAFLEVCRREGAAEVERALSQLPLGAMEDITDEAGNTALHIVAERGSISAFRLLHNAAPDLVDAENYCGNTPLDIAAKHGCLAIVSYIHECQRQLVEEVFLQREYFGCSSCGFCCNGKVRFGRRLCEKGRDHRWEGESIPRHVVHVRATDFADAVKRIKEAYKKPPSSGKWWCKS